MRAERALRPSHRFQQAPAGIFGRVLPSQMGERRNFLSEGSSHDDPVLQGLPTRCWIIPENRYLNLKGLG
jgi:hypothetical protein